MSDTIFVSIASIEDPNLLKTMENLLSMATTPENISFGISLQYENAPDFSSIPNKIKTISFSPNIDSPTAPGIIQIRSEIRNLVEDEEYFLQIDAHTRFKKDWDKNLTTDLFSLMNKNPKTVISSQLWHEADKNIYTQIRIHPTYHYQIESEGLDIYGELVEDNLSKIKSRMVDDKYFLNYYMSGNFIFAHKSFLKNMRFPDYHKFPFEEAELSIVTYCNGYDIVAPVRDHVFVFADNDTKYHELDNKRWWKDVGDGQVRKWVFDTKEDFLEVCDLILTGKNKYMSLLGLDKTVKDFYLETESYEDFKNTKLWYNSLKEVI